MAQKTDTTAEPAMTRKKELQAAIRTVLNGTQRHDALNTSNTGDALTLTETQRELLENLQTVLLGNEIEASVTELHGAIMEALVTRPAVCRGLLAAYLLDA